MTSSAMAGLLFDPLLPLGQPWLTRGETQNDAFDDEVEIGFSD